MPNKALAQVCSNKDSMSSPHLCEPARVAEKPRSGWPSDGGTPAPRPTTKPSKLPSLDESDDANACSDLPASFLGRADAEWLIEAIT
jgi:hypothetical protein